MPPAEDTQTNTVMTYNVDWENAQSLGMFDLAAIHALYGVDRNARTGGQTYTLADRYIWDGAGADTLDAREQTQNLDIRLTAGSWIWSGAQASSIFAPGQAFIGYGTTIERAWGGSGNDRIFGNGAANTLLGYDGNDNLQGLGGNDVLRGLLGNDTLNGGLGDDRLEGGAGLDTLVGGDDNDTLVGGVGKDRLTGGDGADVFTFLSLAEAGNGANRDVIVDFVSGTDRIDLTAIDANELLVGDQVFTYIGLAGFSHQAGELRYTAAGLLAGDVNGDAVADFQIQLTGAPALLGVDIFA